MLEKNEPKEMLGSEISSETWECALVTFYNINLSFVRVRKTLYVLFFLLILNYLYVVIKNE